MAVIRNLFGMNADAPDSETFFGDCFISRTLSAQTMQELETAQEENQSLTEKAELPGWMQLLQIGLLFAATVFTCGILRAHTAPEIWEIIVILLLWNGYIAVKLYERNRLKTVAISTDFQEHMHRADVVIARAKQELHIPETAEEIDILYEFFEEKNGELKHKNLLLTSHINQDMFAFVEGDCLCLGMLDSVFAIPLTAFQSMTLSRKKASFPSWNKDKPYTDKQFKPFRITCNNQGTFFCRYYTAELHVPQGDFYLLIPMYDGETFAALTGLPADTAPAGAFRLS